MKKQFFSLALFAAAWLAGGSVMAQHNGAHNYNEKGICTIEGCTDQYQPATKTDGVYKLANVGNVEWMAAKVNAGATEPGDGGKPYAICSYELTADIDYDGLGTNAHTPIGTYDKKFCGVFDGKGHTILNMKLNQPDRPKPGEDGIGFFGCVRVGNDVNKNAIIHNLTIGDGCEVQGSSAYVGGILGRIHQRNSGNTLLIENCVNKATVSTSANHVAGIVGQINTIGGSTVTIKNCTNEGAITTTGAYAAGILAQINDANSSTVNIIGCTNKGAVQTYGLCAAGIVSQANNCSVALNIESCMNMANVTSTNNKNCGGIHGANTSSKATIKIINCGNTGNVSGTSESATITGWIGSNSGHQITNCWNSGTLNGVSGTANLYRDQNSSTTVTNIYNKYGEGGQGTGITDEMIASGELCYKLNGDQSEIAWTQTLDGTQEYPLPVADGAQVYAHGQLYCDGTSAPGTLYNNEGPDGVIQIPHNISDAIGMCTFCHTQFQEPALVDGYYELKNAGNVEWFGAFVAAGNTTINGKLMNDIDFLNIENLHSPIGRTTGKKYNGTFDGQGFRIKNMIINRDSENGIGFFGYLRGGGTTTIKNLIIDASCSIHGNNRVGAITGSFQIGDGIITIENVVNEANVSANGQDAAGIIGGREDHNPTFIIKNVLNTGDVTSTHADAYVGALCCYIAPNGNSKIENFVNLGIIGTHKGGNIGRHNISDVTNLIDLSDTDNKTQGTGSGLVEADVASGKLAYTVGWWQLLTTDAYPMPFEKVGAVVYRTGEERCDHADIATTVYSNTNGAIVTGSHNYNATTGLCDLCSQPNAGFKSLVNGAYELGSVIDVKWFEAMVNYGSPAINGKVTTATLDFNGGSCRIGNDANSYRGTFQGNGVVVSNFVIDNDLISQGFFGWVTGGADISGIVFDNTCSISCNERAGIIGAAKDGGTVKITRLGNEGNVTTTSRNAGGIIGTDLSGACTLLIDQCYSTGAIKGGYESAQIAGWTGSTSKITNSWSCAEVTGVQSGREFSRYGGDNHDGQYVNCFTTYHETNTGLTYDTPAAKFASGEVAYTINKNAGEEIFYQLIGTDTHPVLDSSKPNVYEISVSDAGYASFVPTVNIASLPTGVTAYIGQINGSSLHLEAVTALPADNAFVVNAAEGNYYYNNTSETITLSETNDLQVATSAFNPTTENTIYCLAKKNGNVGFYPVATTVTIPARKVYLEITSGTSPVKGFFGFDEDDATGISLMEDGRSQMEGGAIYNIAGQRISKMQKGINIVNGKKILK
jgi:hypothetical protein